MSKQGEWVQVTEEELKRRINSIDKMTSDGSTASYYELPEGAKELQDLISHRNMNAQIGEIFRACYRMGMVSHSPEIRDVKKIIFYATEELKRLEKLNGSP
jgi:hypothetical protein